LGVCGLDVKQNIPLINLFTVQKMVTLSYVGVSRGHTHNLCPWDTAPLRWGNGSPIKTCPFPRRVTTQNLVALGQMLWP